MSEVSDTVAVFGTWDHNLGNRGGPSRSLEPAPKNWLLGRFRGLGKLLEGLRQLHAHFRRVAFGIYRF